MYDLGLKWPPLKRFNTLKNGELWGLILTYIIYRSLNKNMHKKLRKKVFTWTYKISKLMQLSCMKVNG